MRSPNVKRDLAFHLSDVARLIRTLADQEVRAYGMTRAQWAVLARLERFEGLKQSELAEMLDIQPITLTRLIDRLCENGLIERRSDAEDRRAKRLYLLPAAQPLLARLHEIGDRMMTTVLAGVDPSALDATMAQLGTMKDNLRQAIRRQGPDKDDERRYG